MSFACLDLWTYSRVSNLCNDPLHKFWFDSLTAIRTRSLPANLQSELPTIEELEAEAAMVPFPDDTKPSEEGGAQT
jgi:hypothetical protein